MHNSLVQNNFLNISNGLLIYPRNLNSCNIRKVTKVMKLIRNESLTVCKYSI